MKKVAPKYKGPDKAIWCTYPVHWHAARSIYEHRGFVKLVELCEEGVAIGAKATHELVVVF